MCGILMRPVFVFYVTMALPHTHTLDYTHPPTSTHLPPPTHLPSCQMFQQQFAVLPLPAPIGLQIVEPTALRVLQLTLVLVVHPCV